MKTRYTKYVTQLMSGIDRAMRATNPPVIRINIPSERHENVIQAANVVLTQLRVVGNLSENHARLLLTD
jgi:hypothetical protein